jgi:hypothetical protein
VMVAILFWNARSTVICVYVAMITPYCIFT